MLRAACGCCGSTRFAAAVQAVNPPCLSAGDGGVQSLSPAFKENERHMQSLLEDLQKLTRKATAGGGSQAVARHKERGKLLPRERIAALLDRGAPFLELSQLAGHELYGE